MLSYTFWCIVLFSKWLRSVLKNFLYTLLHIHTFICFIVREERRCTYRKTEFENAFVFFFVLFFLWGICRYSNLFYSGKQTSSVYSSSGHSIKRTAKWMDGCIVCVWAATFAIKKGTNFSLNILLFLLYFIYFCNIVWLFAALAVCCCWCWLLSLNSFYTFIICTMTHFMR